MSRVGRETQVQRPEDTPGANPGSGSQRTLLQRSFCTALKGLYVMRERLSMLRDARPEEVPLVVPFPQGLGIEVTNACNANCTFCGYQFRERPLAFMSRETFERVIQQYVGLGGGGIGLTPVVGDPLMDRGLQDKIAYARRFPEISDIHLTTNAILLSRKRFEGLVDAGLTMLTISMSSFDRDEYLRVFRSTKYGDVTSNLLAIASSDRFPKVRAEIGLRSDALFPWLKKDYLRLKGLGYRLTRNWFFDSWSGRITEDRLSGFMSLRPQRLSKRIPCLMLYKGPQVLADGRITACGCRDLEGNSDLALGDVWEGTLGAPWEDGRMEGLRGRFVAGNPPNICADCTHYTPASRLLHQVGKQPVPHNDVVSQSTPIGRTHDRS